MFRLFQTDKVIDKIIKHTNSYANANSASEGRPQSLVTRSNLYIQLGLVIYIGIFQQSRREEYQSYDQQLPKHIVSVFMTITRQQQIKVYLYILLPVEELPKDRFFDKIKPITSIVRAKFRETYKPTSSIVIDEIIVRYQGRSSYTVIIREKLIPIRYKLYALCEKGYLQDFLYSSPIIGVKGIRKRYTIVDGYSLTPSSIMLITLYLRLQETQPTYQTLYYNNFFSIIPVFYILRSRSIAATRTARSRS